MITLKISPKKIWDALSKFFKRILRWLSKNWFYTTLIAVAVIGGVCAFLVVPFAVPQPFSKDDSISTLRQAVLVATGGVLAILTLWENRRKNDQEHMRQVHAERRTRYATAIEQLADEKAPIRLGGVYTLIKLVDEWLGDEKTLPSKEERREEGQAIINSLCAYIRSPFDLASRAEVLSQDQTPENYEGGDQQLIKDQARFREEKELRLTIIEAIRNRLNGGFITQEDGTKKLLKGPWSDFGYDFSNAHFFYPVDFANIYFGASSNFFRAKFTENANFIGVTFTQGSDFFGAIFTERANFSLATFTKITSFSEAIFTRDVAFSEVTFNKDAYFLSTTFAGGVDFLETIFTQSGNFFGSTFARGTVFCETCFTARADFSHTTFTGDTDFSEASFTMGSNFYGTTFAQHIHFIGTTFTQEANFSRATFHSEPIFINALLNAKFSHRANPEDYRFEVDPDSPCKIETEEKEYNGVKFRIPKGAILFDPDGSSEQKDNNDS